MFALIDCNNFYVSCERVFNPNLNKKPVVVLSNNDGCAISRSMDNNEKPMQILREKEQIKLKQGERHRLIGLNDFGVVSEIWQHTNPDYPSDENDIVRLSDDYER